MFLSWTFPKRWLELSYQARKEKTENRWDQCSLLNTSPNLYCCSFAKKPTWAQPTGTLNFNYNNLALQQSVKGSVYEDIWQRGWSYTQFHWKWETHLSPKFNEKKPNTTSNLSLNQTPYLMTKHVIHDKPQWGKTHVNYSEH